MFRVLVPLKDASYAVSLGSGLLTMVFKGIVPGQDREALPSLDSSTKRLADGLLQLAFSLNPQVGFFQTLVQSNETVLVELWGNGSFGSTMGGFRRL